MIDGCQCCFCNEGIVETKTDPVDINIIYNEDMIEKTGRFQNFYAHFDCLRQKLHDNIRGYFVK
jgi:hypothetical protein